MGEQILKKNRIVALLLAIVALLGGGGYAGYKTLGSATIDYNCYTNAATSTRMSLGESVGGTLSTTTLLTCSTASAEKLALFFTNEASSTATVTYRVEASQDRIEWYHVSYAQLNLATTATTSDQDLVDPFVGRWARITARSTATTSTNLRLATVEAIAR